MLIRRGSYAPGSIWFQAKIDTPRRSRGGQLLCWPLCRPPLGMFGQAVVIGRYAEQSFAWIWDRRVGVRRNELLGKLAGSHLDQAHERS
jgi:hypothetical protein